VQELAEHRTIQTTMRYAHLTPEHKKLAIAKLNVEVTANLTVIDFGELREVVVSA